jgi:hypothetical protein
LFSSRYLLPQNGPENEKNITYTIQYDNLLFIALDEYTLYHQINQAWLDELLAATGSEYIFAAGHEPAFKIFPLSCLSEYPEERNSFWESLAGAGVKAYFCGHNHFFDHAIIDDGDGNPLNDIHQVIVGTGGGSFFTDSEYNGNNGRWTPVRLFHEENFGYVLAEINGSEVQMKWKHRVEPHVYEDGGDSYVFASAGTDLEGMALSEPFIRNAPNPFHNKTTITYHLPVTGIVDLGVCDLLGQKVTTLIEENQQSGRHEVAWNAEGVKPGIYFCKLKANNFERTVKLIINH